MKLNKDKWKIRTIEDVCENIFAGGDVPKNNFAQIKTKEFKVPIFSNGEKDKGLYGYTDIRKVTKPSLTISARGTIGYSEIREEDFFPIVRLIVLTPDDKLLNLHFLKFVVGNMNFAASGTAIPQLTVPMVKRNEIPLPPLEEQKQIASLFQSIETAMEQVDAQANNLHLLLQKLINDLISEESKIRKGKLKKIEFGEIATNISERAEPQNSIGQVFVGLDHIDSREIKIERFGKPDSLIGTKLKVYEGDIIFGKRNAYLRKAAISTFNGICSAHAMVLRANVQNSFKDYLPFFIHSDSFMIRAKEISEGSISPTIKWKNLEKQEFLIPDIDEQIKFTQIFQQIENIRHQLKQQKTTLKNLKQKLLNEILG